MKSKIFPIVFLFLVTCLIFFKIFTRGLYPIPADLLVSFYFPYYSGGWEGYNSFTFHKEMLNADAIRQIYLWKEFAMDQFKNGKLPLWNPYTFSGQPLLANFQSGVFYPLNVFYFIFDAKNAWILLVVTQPFLGGLFMYMLLRSFKLGKTSAVFGAVAFMFSSYLITWMENVNITNSYIWLPPSILAVHKFFEKQKFRYLLILIISQSFSILGGHPQTAIYIYVAALLFFLYKLFDAKNLNIRSMSWMAFTFAASLTVSAIQLFPTIAFYKISPISLPFSKEVFEGGLLPYQNLITFFASDFFGHPAAGNFWSFTYGDFTPYFGVVPLIFSLWAVITLFKKKLVKFSTAVALLFILASVNSPISYAIKILQIPILDSTTSARFISITIFFLVVLSALGFEDFLKNFKEKKYFQKFMFFCAAVAVIYLSMWVFALMGNGSNFAVTRRNLILPTLMFLSIPAGTLIVRAGRFTQGLLIAGIFGITLIGGIYYSNKFLPVAPKSFIFPQHPLFNWLKENATIDRFYGGGTAHVDFNFPTHYQIYGAEGYDSLRIERYAQLLASSKDGKVPQSYARSDAVFPTAENGYRKRLFELLGVKHLLDKEDNPRSLKDFHYERFPNDKVDGIWQEGKFQIYKRQDTLPRIFSTSSYLVAKDEEIINKIYDPSFNLATLLLEQEPPEKIEKTSRQIAIPQILTYKPGYISIETNQPYNSLLFISDAHDQDWKVTIDGQSTKLLRAHYALMAAAVPKGSHQVVFKYEPSSVKNGTAASVAAIVALLFLSIYQYKKKKF